jgi:hypothetical protein
MLARTELRLYATSENEDDRIEHLGSALADTTARSTDLYLSLWKILSSFPTKIELVKIASSMAISRSPGGSWALSSQLLLDPDQDVVGNALNSVTFSGVRALGHRSLRFFDSRERPQRVLYCLARYAEEAIDRRFGSMLSSAMENDFSDAFLARSFNALFRLGTVDRVAIKIAMDLIGSHIDATNMDRKAAVSAIVYLCFAGDRDDIEQLKSMQNKLTIPELRRLLNWGLYELNGFELQGFDADAAKNFLKRAANLAEPNFTGYGCFEQKSLIEGARRYLTDVEPENYISATGTILALGNPEIIDLLGDHPEIGLESIAKRGLGELKLIWKHYLPSHAECFRKLMQNPAELGYWNDRDAELLYVMLEAKDFLQGQWQDRFVACCQNEIESAQEIFLAQLLVIDRLCQPLKANTAALEDTTESTGKNQEADSMEALALANLDLLLAGLRNTNGAKGNLPPEKDAILSLRDAVYGILIGGFFNPSFTQQIYQRLPLGLFDWEFAAVSLREDTFERGSLGRLIEHQLTLIESSLVNQTIDLDDFTSWASSIYHSSLILAQRAGLVCVPQLFQRFQKIAETLQAIVDAIDSANHDHENDADHNSEDWGHAIKDRPIMRWNSILQVVLRADLSPEELLAHESILRDSMRVAPHVDKRWVVQALVCIGSDDAIKAILYQALQHVDSEFVAHSIRQLLKSPHRRAQQALIRSVGRNTISDELKLTILDEISLESPEELLNELKTLEVLRLPPHIDDAIRDAIGRVAALIGNKSSTAAAIPAKEAQRLIAADVEPIIKKLLPEADLLTVDVRSALRTAEMILIQSKEWGDEAVDLSPIVNMHCKAVELSLRETFEGLTDAIIRKGDLARKLDILGYARPIPEKMQIFEDYLAQLPVVRTIPYFSKFKLRKMLRAICLYRPGKRFTLDGPKAFALLFLVGSRSECPFGLARSIPLSFKSDAELFEFIKIVHSLQDSRNRAVHEGLTWEAQDEIDSMRSQAYKIIEQCIRISKELRKRNLRSSVGLVGVGA